MRVDLDEGQHEEKYDLTPHIRRLEVLKKTWEQYRNAMNPNQVIFFNSVLELFTSKKLLGDIRNEFEKLYQDQSHNNTIVSFLCAIRLAVRRLPNQYTEYVTDKILLLLDRSNFYNEDYFHSIGTTLHNIIIANPAMANKIVTALMQIALREEVMLYVFDISIPHIDHAIFEKLCTHLTSYFSQLDRNSYVTDGDLWCTPCDVLARMAIRDPKKIPHVLNVLLSVYDKRIESYRNIAQSAMKLIFPILQSEDQKKILDRIRNDRNDDSYYSHCAEMRRWRDSVLQHQWEVHGKKQELSAGQRMVCV
jgi:hypothetical protein